MGIVKRLTKYLPKFLRDYIVRNSILLPASIPNELSIQIADNSQDFENSLNLVYENYVKLGYCQEHPSRMRATIYHALPTTTTIIAKMNQQVVATLTIVRDNCLGLPSEKQVGQFDSLRKSGNRIAEITALVIHPEFRREKGGVILFPMLKFMYRYCTEFFGATTLIVSLRPKEKVFYESLLLFEEIRHLSTRDHPVVGGPSIVMQLDLTSAPLLYQRTYSKSGLDKNLYAFFVERSFPNLHYPERLFHRINDPVVSLEYFNELFIRKLSLQLDPSSCERRKVEGCLTHQDFRRMNPRIDVQLDCQIYDENKNLLGHARLKDVSKTGFCLTLPTDIEPLKVKLIRVRLATEALQTEVLAQYIWSHLRIGAGFQILKCGTEWTEWTEYLNRACLFTSKAKNAA